MIMITMPMLTWETVDPEAIYPFERYRAVSGSHEYRIFFGPEAASEVKPWILVNLVIQEIGGVPAHVFHDTYHTHDDAKKAAEHGKARHPEDDGPPICWRTRGSMPESLIAGPLRAIRAQASVDDLLREPEFAHFPPHVKDALPKGFGEFKPVLVRILPSGHDGSQRRIHG